MTQRISSIRHRSRRPSYRRSPVAGGSALLPSQPSE
jgi:hypothetical protein